MDKIDTFLESLTDKEMVYLLQAVLHAGIDRDAIKAIVEWVKDSELVDELIAQLEDA